MIVGDKLAELLVNNGVEHVFGVPGGQTLPLYEGIRKLQPAVNHVLMRDERSAGFAADAYARLTGRAGVCDATVGPGATNLVSPLAEAYCSSIPLIALLSDVPRFWEHRRIKGNASQGVQQVAIFRTISKWQTTLMDARALEDTLDTAFRIATTGKPGPVVVSLPVDLLHSDFNFKDRGHELTGAAYPRFRTAPNPAEVKRAAELIRKAQKPVLVIGGGAHISGAYRQVHDLASLMQAPVITTISGKGIIEEKHSLSFGVTGTFGNPVACEIMQQADVVFFIGSKIGQLTTLGYRVPKRGTPVIHLDADPEEIGLNYMASIPILADARLGLDAVIAALKGMKPAGQWELRTYKKKLQQWYEDKIGATTKKGQPIPPQIVMDAVNQALTDDDLVVTDASLPCGWAAAYLKFNTAAHRFLAPRGLAGLGWGAPAAIGAALAAKREKRVISIVGDGGFSYSVQELEVMRRFNLPVIVIVLNNDVLGWIKHGQKGQFKGNYISCDFCHVDFATVAKGFGAKGYTVKTVKELKDALAKETAPKGPVVIDIMTDQWESPMVGE